MNRTALIDELTKARNHQWECKKELLAADAAYAVAKAKAYLSHYGGKVGHYQAVNQATIDGKVQAALDCLDKAKLAQTAAWIECTRLVYLIGGSDITDPDNSTNIPTATEDQ